MKYVVHWDTRSGGSAAENIEDQKSVLSAFAKWGGFGESVTVHQFVEALEGTAGWAIVETDNAVDIARSAAKFGPWLEFTITPVLDIMDAVAVGQEANDWLDSL